MMISPVEHIPWALQYCRVLRIFVSKSVEKSRRKGTMPHHIEHCNLISVESVKAKILADGRILERANAVAPVSVNENIALAFKLLARDEAA